MANSSVSVVMAGIRGGCVMPAAVYNGTLGLNLYFTDLSGAAQSWSGDSGYTPSLKIRRTSGFATTSGPAVASPSDGTVSITDGATTRPVYFDINGADYTIFGTSTYGTGGFLGGYNGAAVGAGLRWVFNGGTGGAGVSAAAVWAAVRVRVAPDVVAIGGLAGNSVGATVFESMTAGAQAALSISGNTTIPALDAQLDKLVAGSATTYERWMLRIVEPPTVTVSSFTPITNGWSCNVPFTDPKFLDLPNAAGPYISAFNDYACEIIVTKNSDSSVTGLVTSKFRVYRKQIHLSL